MLKLGFIGAGTVGTALAAKLNGQEYAVVAASSRTGGSARKLAEMIPGCQARDNQGVADAAELVFITTPDDVIARVAAGVRWHPGQSVVHCSGAASTDILEPAREQGAGVGTIHPLQTFASVTEAMTNLPGSTFALEGEAPLLTTLQGLAGHLQGSWIELKSSDKVLYHAAAVMACNYLVTLVKLATDLWQTFNVPPETATRALLPLLRGTLHNITTVGIPGCLTGPIARGDTGTIGKHLAALDKAAPQVAATYRELGRQTVPVALAKGKISQPQAAELLAVLAPTETNSVKGGNR
ncbi:MAG: DUF2520 domain-containing protein [Chloroflexota bacterium]